MMRLWLNYTTALLDTQFAWWNLAAEQALEVLGHSDRTSTASTKYAVQQQSHCPACGISLKIKALPCSEQPYWICSQCDLLKVKPNIHVAAHQHSGVKTTCCH